MTMMTMIANRITVHKMDLFVLEINIFGGVCVCAVRVTGRRPKNNGARESAHIAD